MNSYEKYLEEYPEYKKLINVLGTHYLSKEKEVISFVVDENKLNELFEVDDFYEYIKQECLKFLTENFNKDLNKSSIFGNLEGMHKAWKQNEEPDYPPQLPIVIFFIIVASQMGEKDWWSAYYKPLTRAMNLEENKNSRTRLMRQFLKTFTNSENKPGLFNELNVWIKNNLFLSSNFREGLTVPTRHIGWVVSQSIFNQKDLYSLTEFYDEFRLYPESIPADGDIESWLDTVLLSLRRYLNSNKIRQKKYSSNLRKSLLSEKSSSDKTALKIIKDTLLNEISNWNGTVLSSMGEENINGRFAFEVNFHTKENYFDCLLINPPKKYNFSNDENALDNSTDKLVKYKKDEFNNFWSTDIDNLQNTREESFESKKLQVSYQSKDIRVYKLYTEEEPDSFLWVELFSVQKPNNINSYIVSSTPSKVESLKEYLHKNSYNFDENKKFEILGNTFFYDIVFVEGRPFKMGDLAVLNSYKTDSKRLEFTDGLSTSNNTYLKGFLPKLLIPNDFFREEDKIPALVNGKEISIDKNQQGNVSVLDLSQVTILEEFTGLIEIDCINKISIYVEDYKSQSDLKNENAEIVLGYDIEPEKGNLSLNNIYPSQISFDDLKDGYISGGYLNITDEYKIKPNTILVNNIDSQHDITWVVCQLEGDLKKILGTKTSQKYNVSRYQLFNLLNNDRLFRHSSEGYFTNQKIQDDFNKYVSTELRNEMSTPVWEISFSKLEKTYYVRNINEVEPVNHSPVLGFHVDEKFLTYYENNYFSLNPFDPNRKSFKEISNETKIPIGKIIDINNFFKEKENVRKWKKLLIDVHQAIVTKADQSKSTDYELLLKNPLWKAYITMASKI